MHLGSGGAELAALFTGKLDRRCATMRGGRHPERGEVSKEVGTGFRDDRPSPRMEFGGPDCCGGCWLRRRNGLSRRIRKPQIALRRRSPIEYGRMDGATPATQIETEADGAPFQCPALWEAAASLGQRGCPSGTRVEESSLARRQQRLAGITLLGRPGATLSWISRGPRGRQRRLVVG